MWRYTVYDYHHHIPRSQWWSNDRLNLSQVKQKFHVAFHQVFKNMTPDEQYKRLLQFNEKVHSKKFKKEFTEVINSANEGEYMYNQWTRLRDKSHQLQLL